MKNVPESVIAELRQLSGKIRTLCIENNMPCVVSYARPVMRKMFPEFFLHIQTVKRAHMTGR